jgi:anti-sigma regulatory factor (Ser/Thr protein kinase)
MRSDSPGDELSTGRRSWGSTTGSRLGTDSGVSCADLNAADRVPDVSIELPHDLTAPRMARRIVADAARGGGSKPESVCDARLAVSELVSNAVLHGAEPVHLDLWIEPSRLRVEVSDTASAAATFFQPLGKVGGFGLELVAGVAAAWGVEFRPSEHTKTVWFEMRP